MPDADLTETWFQLFGGICKVGKLKFRSTGLKRGGGISGSIGGGGRETEILIYKAQTRSSQALQNLITSQCH
jgi:hypothetical protein